MANKYISKIARDGTEYLLQDSEARTQLSSLQAEDMTAHAKVVRTYDYVDGSTTVTNATTLPSGKTATATHVYLKTWTGTTEPTWTATDYAEAIDLMADANDAMSEYEAVLEAIMNGTE